MERKIFRAWLYAVFAYANLMLALEMFAPPSMTHVRDLTTPFLFSCIAAAGLAGSARIDAPSKPAVTSRPSEPPELPESAKKRR